MLGQCRSWILLAVLSISWIQETFVLGTEDETFKAHFPTAWTSGITPLCYNDSQFYLQSYLNGEKWAFEMYKATGLMTMEGFKNFEVFSSSPGLFDECLSVESSPTYSFQGQYCSAFFKQVPISSTSESKVVVKAEQNGDGGTYWLPRIGFCIPSSCSPSDFRSSVSQWITRNALGFNQSSLIVTINDENYCYTKKKVDSTPQFDGPSIAVLVTLALLATLVLSGTLYDTWRSFKNQPIDTKTKKILLCFSALENGRKILSTKAIASDLPCLHGIRVLSATWIMLLHTYIIITQNQTDVKYGPETPMLMDWNGQAFTRGGMAVDTFFVMGGLLVSLSLLRELKRNNGRFNIFSFYFHRFLRISPFYFIYLGFFATLLIYVGSGPVWRFVHLRSDACRSSWWTHFLYINNYVSGSCLGHSWYLAVDMQLFILSPLFIYPLWRWRRAGLAWAIFVLTSIIIAMGILFIVWSLPVTELKHERWTEMEQSLYSNFYYETWPRIPQYLAGVLLGWFIYNRNKMNETKRPVPVSLHWIVVFSGWILSMVALVAIIYGMIPYLNPVLVPEIDPLVRITYGTLNRIGWAAVVCWIIFACFYGYGGFVNSFLSWKGFMPLGRLSFIAYLVHFDFIRVYYIGFSRTPFFYTKFNLVLNYLAIVTVSFTLAFILSIAIEMPFINLGRILLNSPPEKKNNRAIINAEKMDPLSKCDIVELLQFNKNNN